MNKLKPCPFCGGKAKKEILFPVGLDGTERNMFRIWCSYCDISMAILWDEEKLIKDWNTRQPIDLIKKEISELANVDGNAYLDCADVLEIIKKVEGGT